MAFSVIPQPGSIAWTAYTPVWTAVSVNPTLGNGALTGRYQQVGKTLDVQITLIPGTTTTFGTGAFLFSIPSGLTAVTSTGARQIGHLWVFDTSASTNYPGVCRIDSAGTTFTLNVAGIAGSVTSTTPMTWATSDEIQISARIEVA